MREIELTQGRVAIVDDEDYERINKHKWCAQSNHGGRWYATRIRGDGKKQHKVYMHRAIMDARLGEIIDHKNRNGLDNQKFNLRFCTNGQNLANATKRIGSTSKYKGVSWYNRYDKWRARIQVEGKAIWLGYFDNEDAAGRAYNIAARKYFGEFARTNVMGE